MQSLLRIMRKPWRRCVPSWHSLNKYIFFKGTEQGARLLLIRIPYSDQWKIYQRFLFICQMIIVLNGSVILENSRWRGSATADRQPTAAWGSLAQGLSPLSCIQQAGKSHSYYGFFILYVLSSEPVLRKSQYAQASIPSCLDTNINHRIHKLISLAKTSKNWIFVRGWIFFFKLLSVNL